MAPEFPIEFVVEGTPVSIQAKRAASRADWQAKVRDAGLAAMPAGREATQSRVAAILFYFPAGKMEGDIDNIVKLVLDALCQHIYIDDAQIERVVVQKFEPENIFPFSAPSTTLISALNRPKPLLYVRLSDNPFEDLS